MVTFNYNSGDDSALNRVSLLSFNGGTVAAWSYFGLSSVAETEYDDGTVNSTLASGSSYPGLDIFGRIVNLPWMQSSTVLAELNYGYDQASNRVYRQDAKAGANFDELYSYDAMHRLRSAARGTLTSGVPPITNPTLQQGWHLDATGNWVDFNNFDLVTASNSLMQQRASNAANEITGVAATVGPAWQTPAYDRNGNMTTIPEPLDLTSGYTGVWDAYNRLIYLQSGDEKVEMCLYDGLNRRIMRNTYSPPGTLTESRFFVYSDQWQVLEEYVAATSLTVPVVQWVWGIRYIDDCVLRDSDNSGTLNLRLYALQDANWNVVALYNSATSAVVERYAYTPFGVVQFLNASFEPISESAYAWETLYCGYRYDAAVGLYIVRYRWLHSSIGSWLSRDPAGVAPDLGVYRYVVNAPTGAIDSSGLYCCSVVEEPSPCVFPPFDKLARVSTNEKGLAGHIFGIIDWSGTFANDPAELRYCQCCAVEILVRGTITNTINGVTTPAEYLLREAGLDEMLDPTTFRQDSPLINISSPQCRLLDPRVPDKEVPLRDAPGQRFKTQAELNAFKASLRAGLVFRMDFVFQARVFDVCGDEDQKTVKTTMKEFKWSLFNKPSDRMHFFIETDIPACAGGQAPGK